MRFKKLSLRRSLGIFGFADLADFCSIFFFFQFLHLKTVFFLALVYFVVCRVSPMYSLWFLLTTRLFFGILCSFKVFLVFLTPCSLTKTAVPRDLSYMALQPNFLLEECMISLFSLTTIRLLAIEFL